MPASLGLLSPTGAEEDRTGHTHRLRRPPDPTPSRPAGPASAPGAAGLPRLLLERQNRLDTSAATPNRFPPTPAALHLRMVSDTRRAPPNPSEVPFRPAHW